MKLGPVVSAVAIALAAVAGGGSPARAAEDVPDYQADNREWNGFSDLAALATSMGYDVAPREELDWGELDARDVLFVVYPLQTVEAQHVAAFLRRGGHALIADDQGRGDLVLSRLGIVREDGGTVTGARRLDGNPSLPVAVAWDEAHPLAQGVEELQTNHPSVFRVTPGPDRVFGFGADQAVVVAGTLGEGRFVALSDPSVLINGMLLWDGNLTFAMNLLRFLRVETPESDTGPPPRLYLLTGAFRLSGVPRDPDGAAQSWNERLSEFDRVLEDLNDYVGPTELLRSLGWLGAALALIAGVAVLPLRRPREMDAAFARAREGDRHGFEQMVKHFDSPPGPTSFAYPTAILRDRLEARLAPICGAADPITTLPPDHLIRRVQGFAGPDAAQIVARLAARLRRLPGRAHGQGIWPFVSRREFERLHDDVKDLERLLTNG